VSRTSSGRRDYAHRTLYSVSRLPRR